MLKQKNTKKKFKTAIFLCFTTIFISSCDKPIPAEASWQHAAVGTLSASLSDDGRFSLISSVNHGIGYWDLENNALKFQWKHNDNPDEMIIASDISPDGSRAITADNRNFVIWNTNTGKAYGYWQAPDLIRSVALANKGQTLLLGLHNGLAIHLNIETGRRIEFSGHQVRTATSLPGVENFASIASADLSANGLWALTGGHDYRAILWNTQTGQPRYIFEHKTRVTQAVLSKSGQFAFTSGTRGNAIIWNLKTGQQHTKLALKPREYVISAARFSSNDQWLATGAPGRDISLWDVKTGKLLKRWKAKTRNQWKPSGAIIYAVAFDASDEYLFTEASSGYGQKWRIQPLKK